MQLPFIGGTYLSRSTNINASRAINFYPEMESDKDSKTIIALVGTPGTSLFVNSGASVIRGMRPFNGLIYFVSGPYLYSVNNAGQISSVLGTLVTSTGRISMKDNGLTPTGGNQLIITDGVKGYIYDVNALTFNQISSPGFPTNGASTVTFMDGYFIVNNSLGSQSFYVSNLYDGTTWNALATAAASASPDPIMALAVIHQNLFIVKQYASEFWYDAGVPTSSGCPFVRIGGAVIDYGTSAPWSVAQGDNSLFFLAQIRNNDAGEFIGVVEMNGMQPQVISTPAINYQISQMSTIADAFGYCYSEEGHSFYVLTFPSANATYVYDSTTGFWHERSTYTNSPNSVNRHIGNCYAYYNGKHLIGDWQTGNIYQMGNAYSDDAGNPIISIRTSQHVYEKNDQNNMFIYRLWVDCETGVGTNTTLNPQAELSWSNDGGHTWSNGYQASLGAMGKYKTRLIWRRLGRARDRIWRLQISDPVKKLIIGAGMSATRGTS
jgi:hypothetical protein